MAPADNVLAAVHVLSNRIGRAFYGRIEARHGLSLAEWRVILTLHLHPDATAAEITERWAIDKMAVSRAIRRLERLGHLRRKRDAGDRRSLRLALTASGRRLYARVVPGANARYREIVACLDRSERATLRRALAKLLAHTATLGD